ncbi:uncharacterized protein VTP21DRAFT_5506 [Calcarisporiella thermophila]|uniref:uncharacterized protein n=1 Tax=Calcarisporiella thermophila TaxID=911321 RepID=UPI0037433EF3
MMMAVPTLSPPLSSLSEETLDDSPLYHGLAVKVLGHKYLNPSDEPLFILQVHSFHSASYKIYRKYDDFLHLCRILTREFVSYSRRTLGDVEEFLGATEIMKHTRGMRAKLYSMLPKDKDIAKKQVGIRIFAERICMVDMAVRHPAFTEFIRRKPSDVEVERFMSAAGDLFMGGSGRARRGEGESTYSTSKRSHSSIGFSSGSGRSSILSDSDSFFAKAPSTISSSHTLTSSKNPPSHHELLSPTSMASNRRSIASDYPVKYNSRLNGIGYDLESKRFSRLMSKSSPMLELPFAEQFAAEYSSISSHSSGHKTMSDHGREPKQSWPGLLQPPPRHPMSSSAPSEGKRFSPFPKLTPVPPPSYTPPVVPKILLTVLRDPSTSVTSLISRDCSWEILKCRICMEFAAMGLRVEEGFALGAAEMVRGRPALRRIDGDEEWKRWGRRCEDKATLLLLS